MQIEAEMMDQRRQKPLFTILKINLAFFLTLKRMENFSTAGIQISQMEQEFMEVMKLTLMKPITRIMAIQFHLVLEASIKILSLLDAITVA